MKKIFKTAAAFGLGFLVVTLGFAKSAFADPKAVVDPLIKDRVAAQEYCSNHSDNLLKSYPFDERPQYFLKPLIADGRTKFMFVKGDTPVIFDPEGPVKYTAVDGNYDPVASFDNKILSVLKGNDGDYEVVFYHADSFGKGKPVRIESDLHINGAYQSMAPIALPNGRSGYRVLIDQIKTAKNGDVSMAPGFVDMELKNNRLMKLTPELQSPCSNKRLQVPFLSKDGQMMAALNLETETTQVFRIGNGRCDFVADVGFRTGKADFSYDNSSITFALEEKPTDSVKGWEKALGSDNVSNVMTFDLRKEVVHVTKNVTGNSYYPAFLPDGNILHMDSVGPKGAEKYSVGVSKVPKQKSMLSQLAGTLCHCERDEKKEDFAVGKILSALCLDQNEQKLATDENAIALKTKSLTRKECWRLVMRFWNEENIAKISSATNWANFKSMKKSDFTSLSRKDLLIACTF
jgi:hypothetical protein